MDQEHTHHSKKIQSHLKTFGESLHPEEGSWWNLPKKGEEGRGELRPKEAVKKSPLPNCTEPVGHQRLWAPRRIFNLQHSCPELGLGLIHLHGQVDRLIIAYHMTILFILLDIQLPPDIHQSSRHEPPNPSCDDGDWCSQLSTVMNHKGLSQTPPRDKWTISSSPLFWAVSIFFK